MQKGKTFLAALWIHLKALAINPNTLSERSKSIQEAAHVASYFTVKPDARIHPDIAFKDMGENQQMIAHTTAQQIAWGILDLLPEQEKGESFEWTGTLQVRNALHRPGHLQTWLGFQAVHLHADGGRSRGIGEFQRIHDGEKAGAGESAR